MDRRALSGPGGMVAGLACLATLLFSASRPPGPVVAAATDAHAEGAELFATRGCAHCHGADGKGTDLGPSLRDLRKHLSSARIEQQIAHGGGGMPAFGDLLDQAQINNLVAFLRAKTWTPAPQPPPPESSPASAPDSQRPSPNPSPSPNPGSSPPNR